MKLLLFLIMLPISVMAQNVALGGSFDYGLSTNTCIGHLPVNGADTVGTIMMMIRRGAHDISLGREMAYGWQANTDAAKYLSMWVESSSVTPGRVAVRRNVSSIYQINVKPAEWQAGEISNTWVDIAVSVNGSATKIYYNGKLGSNIVVVGADLGNWVDDVGLIAANSMGGIERESVNGQDRLHFYGSANMYLRWNRQLTDAEIAQVHNTRFSWFPRNGLVHVYPGAIRAGSGSIMDTNFASVADSGIGGVAGTPQGTVTVSDFKNRRRRRQ